MDLKITYIGGTLTPGKMINKPFDNDPGFNDSWWGSYAKGPVEFFTFTSDSDGEVARALTRPRAFLGDGYPTFNRPHGSLTQLDLFEVNGAVHRGYRGPRYGTLCVDLLLNEFPASYFGFSADTGTDGFWEEIGWVPHYHGEVGGPSDRWMTLFAPAD